MSGVLKPMGGERMIYAILLFILFSFISYRLIGSDSSKGNAFLSSLLSFLFSSAIYYVFHLKDSSNHNFIQFDHFTFLYFITLIVVAMGFTLLLEMMKDGKKIVLHEASSNPIERVRIFFKTKIRYGNLLFIIARNGLLKSTLQTNKELRHSQTAKAFRSTLEEAGGVFIKFGQFLSTRSDLLSKSFIEELAQLQENAPSIPSELIKDIIEDQLKTPLDQLFQSFDEQPLAAASIAQVHRAQLNSGEEVVIKILRPELEKQLTVDITILQNFALLLATKTAWAKQIGIVGLTNGFIQNLLEEIDFSIELGNMHQMKQVSGDKVYIPQACEEYSNSNILVMEFLDGVSINRSNILVYETGINQEKVVNDIFQEMLAQIFDKGVFHGDPHPGNIFILKNGLPAFIDFGSVGRLSTIQRTGFKWLLIGINRRNAESMVTGLKDLLENGEDLNTRKMEQLLSQFLIDHTFEGDIMDEMSTELFSIMSQQGLQFYPSVAGAFRSIITLQGSLQTISTSFNLSEMIDTYVKSKMTLKSMKETIAESMEDDLLNILPKIKEFPRKIENIIQKVENGDLTLRMSLFSEEANVKYVNSVLSLVFMGFSGLAFGLISLGALFLAQSEASNGYSFLNVFGYAGLGLSIIMLIRVTIQSMRREQ